MGSCQIHYFPAILDQQMAVACSHIKGISGCIAGALRRTAMCKFILQSLDQDGSVLRADLPGTVI